MTYYKIVFEETPHVSMAHSHKTQNFYFTYEQKINRCEIMYIEQGDIALQNDTGEERIAPALSILCWPYLHGQVGMGTGSLHKHYTFCIASRMSIFVVSPAEIMDIGRNLMQTGTAGGFTAIIPDSVAGHKCVGEIARLIRLIISRRALVKPNADLTCTAAAMEVFALLTDYSFEQVSSNATARYSDLRYCERAIAYINTHLSEKISASDIAGAVGISVGYLSRIFKDKTGKSMVAYVNQSKINYARTMIGENYMPLSDIAQKIGISDKKYLYRLFKQQTGMTIGAYMNLKRDD